MPYISVLRYYTIYTNDKCCTNYVLACADDANTTCTSTNSYCFSKVCICGDQYKESTEADATLGACIARGVTIYIFYAKI